MLPKQKRLNRAEFSRFFTSGKRIPLSFGHIVYADSDTQKAAVVVGKKVSKKAVERNRIRRQLYHMLRDWLVSTDATGVYILITKPTVRTMTASAVKDELQHKLESIR